MTRFFFIGLLAVLTLAPQTVAAQSASMSAAARSNVATATEDTWWGPRYIVDYGLIAAGGGVYLLFGQLDPNQRALFGPRFDPEDPTEILGPEYADDLGRPYADDAERGLGQTVPEEHMIVGIAGVAGLMALEEGLYWGLSDRGSARRFHDTLIGFGETVALNAGVTEIAKVSVGRLRPDFQARARRYLCQTGDADGVDCTDVRPLAESDAKAEEILTDGRKSFFSGHSSFGLAVSTYAALVIGGRWVWSDDTTPTGRALGILLQSAVVASGLFITGSRLDDGRHHVTDVLVGGALGFGLANFAYWRRFGGDGEPVDLDRGAKARFRLGPGPGRGLALTVTY